jgi:hypothetical protein
VTLLSSSGPAPAEPASAFGRVNLLAERITAHEANLRKSWATIRAGTLLVLAGCIALPYLYFTYVRLDGEVATRSAGVKAAADRADAMKAKVDDLSAATRYVDRTDVAQEHLARWRGLLSVLQAGTGQDGFVSHISMRLTNGAMAVAVHGEAPSLADANRLGTSLREHQATRDLRLVSVKSAEVLEAEKGAVRYELTGTTKLK